MKLDLGLYERAKAEYLKGELEKAFEDYSDLFLCRLGLDSYELEFVTFFRYQLAKYLEAKRNFFLSLPEGDMISELIKDSYDDYADCLDNSVFNITGDGRFHLLESIKIVFPWQNDTEEDENCRLVSV